MPPATTAWYTEHVRIPEHRVPGKRLGRHVSHDSRNKAYPWRAGGGPLTSQLWPRHTPILDQGDIGSCTGNMETGDLGTDPVYGALPAAYRAAAALNEALALKIYSAAETIDGDGPYPPNDNGSSGPSAAKAAMKLGLISGYLHCLSLADVLDALEEHPVGIGANWYDSFDSPDSSGLVTISPGAQVRGGHEFLCRGKDIAKKMVYCDNSWGAGWGSQGSFMFSWDDLERLLTEQGDGTVSLPLTTPAPVPVPVPPGPSPDPGPDDADTTLWRNAGTWAGERHTGQNKAAAGDLKTWAAAKGFA